MKYTVSYKGKILSTIAAETKWHAIAIVHNNAIAAGFNSNRNHYDAYRQFNNKQKTKNHEQTPTHQKC